MIRDHKTQNFMHIGYPVRKRLAVSFLFGFSSAIDKIG